MTIPGPVDHDLSFSRIIERARIHYENLKADIPNAHTRIEHIRLTALAQEALNLLTDLESFEIGMVYTRVQGLNDTDLKRYIDFMKSSREERAQLEDGLSNTEFKSPFTPPSA